MRPPMSEVAWLWIRFFGLHQEMWQSMDVHMVEVKMRTGGSLEVQTAEGRVMCRRRVMCGKAIS